MTAHTQDIIARLDQLEARLAAIESRLAARESLASPLAALQTPLQANPLDHMSDPLFSVPDSAAPHGVTAPPSSAARPSRPRPLRALPLQTVRSTSPRMHERARAVVRDLEFRLAGHGYALAGGLVVIIGVIFFYQFALRQGWFTVIPDWGKCTAGAIFGATLLFAAHRLRPRINTWAATGLSLAGLGSMYVAAFMAHDRYHLISSAASFALLAFCGALGLVFAVNARLRSVASLSLIAAFLAPILLPRQEPQYVLPGYWLILLAAGTAIPLRFGDHFSALRRLAWWGVVLFGAIWVFASGRAYPTLALAFIAAAWGLVHAGLWYCAHRLDRDAAREIDQGLAPDVKAVVSLASRGLPLLSSFGMTGWAVALAVAHVQRWNAIPDWLPPACGGAVTAMIALILASHLRLLRDPPENASERLGATLAVQSAALIITAVAIGLTGRLEVATWLVMGLASLLTGRWASSPPLRLYGALILLIATLRLLAYDATSGMARPVAASIGLVFSWWMLLVAATAASWITAAFILRPAANTPRDLFSDRAGPPPAGVVAAGLGVALLLIAVLHQNASATAVTTSWIAIAAGCLVLNRAAPNRAASNLGFALHGSLAAAAALLAWTYSFVAHGWSPRSSSPLPHPGLLTSLPLAAVIVAAAHEIARELFPRNLDERPVRPAGVAIALLLLLTATSFEASRYSSLWIADRTAGLAAVSIWWGLFALGLLAAGAARASRAGGESLRRAGLALLGLGTVKALFIDTAHVSLGWRVVSVLGLGLLMLGVGVAYARLTRPATPAVEPPSR